MPFFFALLWSLVEALNGIRSHIKIDGEFFTLNGILPVAVRISAVRKANGVHTVQVRFAALFRMYDRRRTKIFVATETSVFRLSTVYTTTAKGYFVIIQFSAEFVIEAR